MGERKASWSKTRNAPDYRSFLRAYLEESGWSLSDLARAAGFGRGFPGDVISGKRRLTAKSYRAFENALKIPAAGKRLFRCLVGKEEPEVFPGLDPRKIDRALKDLRARPWTGNRKQIAAEENPRAHALFAHPDAFAVYAAAGSAEAGATRDRIRVRTRLGEAAMDRAIESLVNAGILLREDERYRPESTHVFLKASERDECFARLFQAMSERAAERAPKGVSSDRELFLVSSFCVDERKLPELKTALRKTLLQFVDDSIEADGDRLVQLVTSLS